MARKIFWVVAVLGAFICLDKALAMVVVQQAPVNEPVTIIVPTINSDTSVSAPAVVSPSVTVSSDGSAAVGGSSGAVSGSSDPSVVASGGGSASTANMANPASVNCVNLKGTLEIRTDANGGQVGYCLLPGGKTCEEWGLFRGECEGYPAATPSDEQPTTGESGLLTGGAPSDVVSAKAVQSQATIVVPPEIQPMAEQAVAADANIRTLKVEGPTIVVRYEQPAKLFGFIPVKYQATITANTESKKVVVKKPWWLFFAKSDFANLRSMITEKTASGDSGKMESLPAQEPMDAIDTQSGFITVVSSVLKLYSQTQKAILENLR